jgi:septum formation protein
MVIFEHLPALSSRRIILASQSVSRWKCVPLPRRHGRQRTHPDANARHPKPKPKQPRRSQLLTQIGLKDFTIRVSTFEEDLPKIQYKRRAAAYALHTALHKALDVTRMEHAEIAAAAAAAAATGSSDQAMTTGVSGVTPTASIRALSSVSDDETGSALPLATLLALPDLVVSADTVVESPSGEILEKPESDAHHADMLRSLSGAAHRVHTGVALVVPRPGAAAAEALLRERRGGGEAEQPQPPQRYDEGFTGACLKDTSLTPEGWLVRTFAVTTRVRFADLSDKAIDAYIRSGDGAGKAGGYGIQGKASAFVQELCGDYFSVVGFPLHAFSAEVSELIEGGALELYGGEGEKEETVEASKAVAVAAAVAASPP